MRVIKYVLYIPAIKYHVDAEGQPVTEDNAREYFSKQAALVKAESLNKTSPFHVTVVTVNRKQHVNHPF